MPIKEQAPNEPKPDRKEIHINPYALPRDPSRLILWPSATIALIGGANIIATKLFGLELGDSVIDVSRNFAIIGIIGAFLTISYNLGRRVITRTLDSVTGIYPEIRKNFHRDL